LTFDSKLATFKENMLNGHSKITMYEVAKRSGWKEPAVLIWRDAAKHVRPSFVQTLYKESGPICELDFSGIETADGSFLDELIVTELKKIDQGKTDKRFMYMSHLNDVTLFNADLVFGKKRPSDEKYYMLVNSGGGKWQLLCEGLEASLKETLTFLMAEKQITSNDVAKKFKLSIAAASVRLKGLYNLRLAQRTEETTSTGKEFAYKALF